MLYVYFLLPVLHYVMKFIQHCKHPRNQKYRSHKQCFCCFLLFGVLFKYLFFLPYHGCIFKYIQIQGQLLSGTFRTTYTLLLTPAFHSIIAWFCPALDRNSSTVRQDILGDSLVHGSLTRRGITDIHAGIAATHGVSSPLVKNLAAARLKGHRGY